jgi:hypothetical protein
LDCIIVSDYFNSTILVAMIHLNYGLAFLFKYAWHSNSKAF